MKIMSKEAAVLGGLYTAFWILVSYGQNKFTEHLFMGVSILFVIGLVMLAMNKTPKILMGFIQKYPRVSYYLASIGWFVYVLIIGVPLLILAAICFEWSDATSKTAARTFNFILSFGVPLSLLAAFVRRFNPYKKHQK